MSNDRPKKEEPVPFVGKVAEMRDSPWLASEDIEGRGDVALVIAKVWRYRNVEFEKGRTKETVYALQFEKARRKLVLNATNRKTIQALHGDDVKGWIGKTVTLYIEPRVRLGKEFVRGIRIRRD